MSAGFTPGHWSVSGWDNGKPMIWSDVQRGGADIAVARVGNAFDGPDDRDRVDADAHLIAAAPELYEAASLAIPAGVCLTNRNIPDDFSVALDCTMGDLRKIAAALAKARGEA